MSFRMDGQASAALLHLEHMLLDETAEPKALPLSLLESITDGFSPDHQIGRGGFAVVYKGTLQNGTVAVKRLLNIHMDENEFQREVQCLMKVKHKNIVRFLGYCADTQGNMTEYNGKLVMADVQQRLLCFEYLPNGSVHDYITDASSRLEWRTCYKIIKGICNGLHYLHGNHIVHLDLKPLNVLLDEHMVPKIADFGLSRCFEENQSQTITSKVVGSLGYFAPELYSGKITMKSDIYSLGVIIIEVLTGEKGCPDVGNVLASWSGRLKKSYEDTQLEQVRVCTEIGIDCSDFNPAKRPIGTQNIIERLKETETMDEESSAVSNTVSRKLFVHPRVLYFPYAPNKLGWSSVYLTNYTDEHMEFRLFENQQTFEYLPLFGIVPPRSTYALALTTEEREEQFTTLVLESASWAASNSSFQSKLDDNDWHDFFEEAKMNATVVQRVILEAVATGRRGIMSELKPPRRKIFYAGSDLGRKNCLDVNPSKQWIITGSTRGNVRIWNYRTQKKVDSFKVSIETVVSVKFIIQKKWFVAGSTDGFIHVYDYETKMRRNLSFKAHIKPLKSLAVHPSKPYLLSSGSHVIKLWDWDKGWEHIRTFKSKYPGSICNLAFNPKNTNCFVTASDNHIVEVWSIDSPQSEYTLSGHLGQVNCFDFFTHDQQQYLITGSNDFTAKIWNMHKKMCIYTLQASTYPVTSVLFYPNLLVLVIGLENATVQLWSWPRFRFERIINDDDNTSSIVWGLACLVRSKGFVMGIGRTLALVDMDNVNDQEELSHYSEPQFNADMSQGDAIAQMIPDDGELLAVQPLELRFPIQLYNSSSCSLDLTNNTNERVAFSLREKSMDSSFFANLPMCGIIPPRSTCTLIVIIEEHEELPEETNFDLILLSSISGDKYIVQFQNIFECDELFEELRQRGNAVHEVALRAISYPQGDIKCEVVPHKEKEPVVLHGYTTYGRTMSIGWKFLDAHPTETWILTADSDGYVRIRNLVTEASY
uniref:Uncharacterized protein n=1 Tax=Avena sativa TaxID=4498 RepID=A0ACD6A3V6_AVESA